MRRSRSRRIRKTVGQVLTGVGACLLAVVLAFLLYLGITKGYEFGYRVFNEPPVSPDNGTIVEYTVDKGDGITEIARELADMGMIRDPLIMVVQKIIYQYTIYPGEYSLSTAMSSMDILERIGTAPEEAEE